MKKYAFRLETVRRVRRVQEDQAKGELLRKNAAVQLANKTVTEKNAEYETAVQFTPAHVTGIDHFMRRRYLNELAGLALVAAKSSLAAAESEAEIARATYTDAAKRVRALDRLDEKAKEAHAEEVEHAAVVETDDVVSGRWIRDHDVALASHAGNTH